MAKLGWHHCPVNLNLHLLESCHRHPQAWVGYGRFLLNTVLALCAGVWFCEVWMVQWYGISLNITGVKLNDGSSLLDYPALSKHLECWIPSLDYYCVLWCISEPLLVRHNHIQTPRTPSEFHAEPCMRCQCAAVRPSWAWNWNWIHPLGMEMLLSGKGTGSHPGQEYKRLGNLGIASLGYWYDVYIPCKCNISNEFKSLDDAKHAVSYAASSPCKSLGKSPDSKWSTALLAACSVRGLLELLSPVAIPSAAYSLCLGAELTSRKAVSATYRPGKK